MRSLDSDAQMEEERRLCYVGMTRAEKRLFLSWARFRRRFGGGQPLPLDTVLADLFQRVAQAGQQGFAGLMDLMEHGGLALAQGLRFALGQREQFAADGLVGAEVGEHLGKDIHGLAW
jgi:hypothetical protein